MCKLLFIRFFLKLFYWKLSYNFSIEISYLEVQLKYLKQSRIDIHILLQQIKEPNE